MAAKVQRHHTRCQSNQHNRDSFKGMMDSVKAPFPKCVELLRDAVPLDPYFKEFYQWSREVGMPVIVLSSGMTPIIRALLVHLVGPEAHDIEVVCNEAVDRPPKKMDEEGGWELKFHDDSDFGHDKSLTIRPYAKHFEQHPDEPRPTMFYAGDDLIEYCEREGVPFTVFKDWKSILATTKEIYEGKTTAAKVANESAEAAKKKVV
ncbi:hypothetical protein P7C71_g5420, partial [Lecanoromycetidae sp. Uapishka_2]